MISVNTGPLADLLIGGKPGHTGIDKRPAAGPVRVATTGLAGDDYGAKAHQEYDQAVFAYAREDLDWWVEQLGYELRDGQFGENITTSGLDITGAVIGEAWQVGSAVMQVTAPRIPCSTFQSWMGEQHWVRRFARAARPGAYMRVLEEGEVGRGDTARVVSRPRVRVTLPEAMLAYYGDAELMRKVLEVQERGSIWDEVAPGVLRRPGA